MNTKSKTITLISVLMALSSASYAEDYYTDTTVNPGDPSSGMLKFAADNITVTLNTDWNDGWSIRGSDAVKTKATLVIGDYITYTETLGNIFADPTYNTATGTFIITGESGTYNATGLSTANITPTAPTFRFSVGQANFNGLRLANNTKLYLDAGNMNISGLKMGSGATFNITGGTLYVVAYDDNRITLDGDGSKLIVTGGKYIGENASTEVGNGAILDLGVSKGFITRYFTLKDKGTLIIRADNALLQDESGKLRVFAYIGTSTLKLYANQAFAEFWGNATTDVVNAYTNGYDLTFNGVGGQNGTLNIFIESGYEWENNAIHFASTTKEVVEEVLGDITIGDVKVDKSNVEIVSDGSNGYYVNLIAVPEPSTMAAIFGFIALFMAARRRRR